MARKPKLVQQYLEEQVNFGGERMSRGEMIRQLTETAKASGHPDPQKLVNTYLAGHEQGRRIRGEA